MEHNASKLEYSAGIVLTLPIFAFFFVYVFGIFVGLTQGKTLFLGSLGAFLLALAALGAFRIVPQIFLSPAQTAFAIKQSTLFGVAISMLPYAAICFISEDSSKQLIYLAIIYASMALALHFRIDEPLLSKLAIILFIAVSIHLLLFPVLGFPKFYKSLFAQKNVFALNILIIFFSSYFVFQTSCIRNNKVLAACTMVTCITLVLLSHSRGVFLDIAFFLFLSLFWRFFSKSRFRYWAIFCSFILMIVALIPTYVFFSYSAAGYQMNAFVHEYTGVQLFSGRNIIWPAYLYFITLKPFLGYGFGDRVANMMMTVGLPPDVIGLSAHNLYLMVATQTGLLGLTALIFFFGMLWALLYRNRLTKVGSIACVVFLTGLFNEMLEVTLIQTNFDVVVFFWFLVALGLRMDRNANAKLR